MRIEPPPSVPRWNRPAPVAAATAAPPEEPPGVMAGFHGLRVMPLSGLSVSAFQPNSGVVVRPSSVTPAASEAFDGGGVGRAGRSRGTGRAVADGPAFDPDDVLDGRRNAVDARQRRSRTPARFGGPRRREGTGAIYPREGVEGRLDRLGAIERRRGNLDRRQVSGRERGPKLLGRQAAESICILKRCPVDRAATHPRLRELVSPDKLGRIGAALNLLCATQRPPDHGRTDERRSGGTSLLSGQLELGQTQVQENRRHECLDFGAASGRRG